MNTKKTPTLIKDVTFYPILAGNYFGDNCKGCAAPKADIRCAKIQEVAGSKHGCYPHHWEIGDEAMAKWTLQRLTE